MEELGLKREGKFCENLIFFQNEQRYYVCNTNTFVP